jgi:MoaA/NifB/PqqE/SkfB family radical SAM enzyme
VKAIKKSGSQVGIITNCMNLNSIFGRIKNYIEAYMLPLDGDTEVIYREIKGTNNFSEVISWPKKIKEDNPSTKVILSCLIQKKNVNRIVNIYRLASKLPVDALFFRVPELKNNCFGGFSCIPSESLENAYLSKNDIQNLKESFRKILKLDSKRKLLFQNEELFKKFVKYFKLLRGEKVKFVDRLCNMPFTSIVIDESKNISPCFYLPFSIPFQKISKDFINNTYLKNIRKRLVEDTKFRNNYCSNCLQCIR